MTAHFGSPLIVNGWKIYAHPMFLMQLEALMKEVENLRDKWPETYRHKANTQRLAAIVKLTTEIIPQDPTRPAYRQGKTLSTAHKHWFRAKFFQQYRLFFRYQAETRIIVFAWVNDETSKRAYDSGSDAYAVFARMLQRGSPPDDWGALLAEASPLHALSI